MMMWYFCWRTSIDCVLELHCNPDIGLYVNVNVMQARAHLPSFVARLTPHAIMLCFRCVQLANKLSLWP